MAPPGSKGTFSANLLSTDLLELPRAELVSTLPAKSACTLGLQSWLQMGSTRLLLLSICSPGPSCGKPRLLCAVSEVRNRLKAFRSLPVPRARGQHGRGLCEQHQACSLPAHKGALLPGLSQLLSASDPRQDL